jgi:hypothetical protein
VVEDVEKKHRVSSFFRDHGHEQCIRRSYEMVRPRNGVKDRGWSVDDVRETGNLFLNTRKALETNQVIVI